MARLFNNSGGEMKATVISGLTNGARATLDMSLPYSVDISIQGSAAFLFHRWNDDAVEAKSKAAKNSKAKKTDDLESYVYRDDKGFLAIPSEYIRQAIIHSAKFTQDPRSPRKSGMDLFKAGIVCLNELCSLGIKDWDYLDRRRVVIQRSAVTRTRPALLSGWNINTQLMVLTPEYITPETLNSVLSQAGRLIGIGDFRPTFGRFQITKFEVCE
jgi:hypothetical protein